MKHSCFFFLFSPAGEGLVPLVWLMAGAGHSGSLPGVGLALPARPLGTSLVGAGLWGHPGQVKRHIGQKWQLQEALGEPGWGGSSQPWAALDPCDCPQTRGSARMASNLPPELLQNVYNFPKLIKAGTSTFPFPTPARHTHFFPKGSVKLQVGAVACQGMAGLTRSSKAWEILAYFPSGSGLRRSCGSVRPTLCLLPAPGVSPSSSGAGILVLHTKSLFSSSVSAGSMAPYTSTLGPEELHRASLAVPLPGGDAERTDTVLN